MEVNKGCQDAWENLLDGPDPSGCVHKLMSNVTYHFSQRGTARSALGRLPPSSAQVGVQRTGPNN